MLKKTPLICVFQVNIRDSLFLRHSSTLSVILLAEAAVSNHTHTHTNRPTGWKQTSEVSLCSRSSRSLLFFLKCWSLESDPEFILCWICSIRNIFSSLLWLFDHPLSDEDVSVSAPHFSAPYNLDDRVQNFKTGNNYFYILISQPHILID